MKIQFIGVGTVTDTKAQSCILITDNDTYIVVDIGCGSMQNLQKVTDINKISAILLTHNHLDHNGDLLNFLKTRYLLKGDKISIFGPKGTKNFVNCLLNCYPYLYNKVKFKVFERKKFKIDNIKVKTYPTIHSIESFAYEIKTNDAGVIISGDTKPIKDIIEIESKVLIHEMSLPFKTVSTDHTTPEEFASLLKYCKSEIIYLTHLYPQTIKIKNQLIQYLKQFYNCLLYTSPSPRDRG